MTDFEEMALQLKSLLAVIAGVDTYNKQALEEIPYALKPAVELAEKLYCGIVERKEG